MASPWCSPRTSYSSTCTTGGPTLRMPGHRRVDVPCLRRALPIRCCRLLLGGTRTPDNRVGRDRPPRALRDGPPAVLRHNTRHSWHGGVGHDHQGGCGPALRIRPTLPRLLRERVVGGYRRHSREGPALPLGRVSVYHICNARAHLEPIQHALGASPQPLRAVLITVTSRNRVAGQPCDTAFACPG